VSQRTDSGGLLFYAHSTRLTSCWALDRPHQIPVPQSSGLHLAPGSGLTAPSHNQNHFGLMHANPRLDRPAHGCVVGLSAGRLDHA
jgi:hypothetical protein